MFSVMVTILGVWLPEFTRRNHNKRLLEIIHMYIALGIYFLAAMLVFRS